MDKLEKLLKRVVEVYAGPHPLKFSFNPKENKFLIESQFANVTCDELATGVNQLVMDLNLAHPPAKKLWLIVVPIKGYVNVDWEAFVVQSIEKPTLADINNGIKQLEGTVELERMTYSLGIAVSSNKGYKVRFPDIDGGYLISIKEAPIIKVD